MGVTIREKVKGSGEYWIFIAHQGKRKAKKIGKDRRLASDVAKKIEARLVLGDFKIVEEKRKVPLFKDYAELWLNGYIKELRRPSTYERYSDILNRHVYPTLSREPLDQIKRGDIRNLLLDLHKSGVFDNLKLTHFEGKR